MLIFSIRQSQQLFCHHCCFWRNKDFCFIWQFWYCEGGFYLFLTFFLRMVWQKYACMYFFVTTVVCPELPEPMRNNKLARSDKLCHSKWAWHIHGASLHCIPWKSPLDGRGVKSEKMKTLFKWKFPTFKRLFPIKWLKFPCSAGLSMGWSFLPHACCLACISACSSLEVCIKALQQEPGIFQLFPFPSR